MRPSPARGARPFRAGPVAPVAAVALAALVLAACGAGRPPAPSGDPAAEPRPPSGPSPSVAPRAERRPPAPAPPAAGAGDPLRDRVDLPPERRALLVVEGEERIVDAEAAARAGYTLVDLSDSWTPLIFAEHPGADGAPLANRYRRIYVGQANDQLDNDGQALEPGRRNYLELFGIPPSLSVLRLRFLDDAGRACQQQVDLEILAAVETVTYIPPEEVRRQDARIAQLVRELEAQRRAAGLPDLAALALADPKAAPKVKLLEKRAAERLALTEVEERLACEGMLSPKRRHTAGVYDDAMRLAVTQFQEKHMIYESHYLRRKTMDALAAPPLANDHAALVRVLTERVVAAAGVIEDGSTDRKAGPITYLTAAGARVPLRNLADEYARAAIEQLGLATPEAAAAFFRRRKPEDFAWLRAAIKLAPLPEYYADHMELSVVVDRGDVWYEPPFDATGKWKVQPRKKYPSFTLLLRHGGQQLALARWRTTIGGWRAEQASDGYEYFRYKGSDVGPRVVRSVAAGPVWIAPASTPIRSLVKSRTVAGSWQKVVNYDEIGPGYRSAYGLVAGYFVVPGKDGRPDWDNGIRAHGSSEYLSMYSPTGYSHGCHRLPNHLAIRLYSFLLRHRKMRVIGDQTMGFLRQFLSAQDVYELRIPSRGYGFQLEPPLPVSVLEGEIQGTVKRPIGGYVPIPGVRYPGPPPPTWDSPEAKAGGTPPPAGAPGADEGTP